MEPMAESFQLLHRSLFQLWSPVLFAHCVKEVVSHIDTFGLDFKPFEMALEK